jgi:hypothetical protein
MTQRHLCSAYDPIADILARPRIRILRALRWWEWVDSGELFQALGVPDYEQCRNPEWNQYAQTLGCLAKTGRCEADRTTYPTLYRLTDLGRADLKRTLAGYVASVDKGLMKMRRVA